MSKSKQVTKRRAPPAKSDECTEHDLATRASSKSIMVCVGTSPYGDKLVHLAHESAVRQQTSWHAVYVESHKPRVSTLGAQGRVWGTLGLAESLGATTSILTGPSAADAILTYARENHIAQVIVGNSQAPTWRRVLGLSLVDELLRCTDDIDLRVVGHREPHRRQMSASFDSPWTYAAALGLAALATGVGLPARGMIAPSNFITTYLLALVVAAVYLGFGAAALTALFSVLAFDFFYLPAYYRLALSDWANLLPLVAFLAIGGVISPLVRQSRRQAKAARQREAHTHALFLLSRDLTTSTDLAAILDGVINHWCRIFGGNAAVMLPDETGHLEVGATSSGFKMSTAARERAVHVYQRASADEAMKDLKTPAVCIVALKTANSAIGVLVAERDETKNSPTPEQDRVMEAFANQAALAIERVRFARDAQQAEVLRATEALQSALLNSVSHDLRTPLASITGVLSTLYDEAYLLDESTEHELVGTALSEAQRLNNLVGNLLDMSRIEADALHLTQDLNEVQDLIGTTWAGIEQSLGARQLDIHMAEDLPLIPMDFVLMSRVLHNLIENADKYAPEGTPIELEAGLNASWLKISVADRGPGVPGEDLEKIFGKFYRSPRTGRAMGTGLGLAISEGIMKAHGGRIWAENRDGGGLRVTIALPLSRPQLERSEEGRKGA